MQRPSYLIVLALLVVSSTAFAHTKLTESAPPADATLAASPDAIELQFSQPVRLTALSLLRDETRMDLGAIPKQPATTFSVAIPNPLTGGVYSVEWRAVTEDTHVVSGDFAFTVNGQ